MLCPPEYRIRQPLALGLRPEASSSMPAFASSSWYAPVLAMSVSRQHNARFGVLGGLTMIMNRMIVMLYLQINLVSRRQYQETGLDPTSHENRARAAAHMI